MAEQVNAGAKVESIGTVKTVVGEVKAVDASGVERILQAGDKVYPNETIMTAVGALVLIEFMDGTHLDLPSSSQIVLDTDVFNPANAVAQGEELTAEQIQEMIARGEDPTAVTEATAAGAGAGDEGGSSFIVVDFNNTQGDVTSGFNTLGIPGPESTTFTELPPVEDEAAPVPVPPVPVVSVEVEVEVEVEGETPPPDPEEVLATTPGVVVDGVSVVEGTDDVGRIVNFIIKLDQAYAQDVTVSYQIDSGTAIGGSDYSGTLSGTVTIPAGQTSFIVPVNIVQDSDLENNENFSIVLTGATNATINPDASSATVTIIDDDVNADNDADTVTESQLETTEGTFTGTVNVLDNDDLTNAFAADGTTPLFGPLQVTTDVVNAYIGETLVGQVDFESDGTYTLTLNETGMGLVSELVKDDTLEVTADYSMVNTVGSSDSAVLTITIIGTNDGPQIVTDSGNPQGANDVVYESGLATGSDAAATSEFASGTFTVSDPDGLDDIQNVTINGTVIAIADLGDNNVIDGASGILTVTGYNAATGIATYTYELTSPTTDVDGAETDVFTLTTSDGIASSDSATITIEIVDDAPQVDPDSGNVTEGATLVVAAAQGVLADDTSGADGWAPSGAVVGVVTGDVTTTDTEDSGTVGVGIVGLYGTLTLSADGSYTYVANPDAIGQDATDVFVYTVKDGDGDLESTTLTINLADVTGTPTDTEGAVNEAGLADSATVAADGTNEPSDSEKIVDGSLNLQTGWTAVASSGTSTYGTWSVDADGTFTYELTANTAGDTTSDSFEYTAEDEFGNTVTNTVTISIVDDAPQVDPDSGNVTEGATLVVAAAQGVLADDTSGADGWAPSGAVVGVVTGDVTTTDTEDSGTVGVGIVGLYGTLTLSADGSYTYVANPDAIGQDATDVFVYTVKDGDGDLESTTLTINLADVTLVADNGSALVDEAALETGTNPGSTAETDGDGALNVAGAVSYEFKSGTDGAGTYGTLTLDADGTYSYALTSAMDSGSTQGRNTVNGVETFYYVATDANGNTVEGTITVDIKDDVPVVTDADNASVSTADGSTDTGSLGITIGADLTGASVSLLISGAAANGQQVLDSNGDAVTSGGDLLYYFSDGAGGLYVATEEGGDHVLEITPTIASDGTTSYSVEVTGLIDHNIDSDSTNISVTVIEYGSETVTLTGDFTAGSLPSGNYKPQNAPVGGTLNGYDSEGNQIGTLNFSFRGYSDSDSTAGQYVFGTASPVSVSGQNVGVSNNMIDNKNSDGDGEILKLTFTKTVTQLSMLFDQLDTGETAWYSIDQGATWVSVSGTSQGGSQSSDESIETGITSGFTELWIRGGEGSSFGILINSLEATWTEEVPTETEHNYNVSVIDVTGADQTVTIDAQAIDGDDDLSDLVNFDVHLDATIDYDAVAVSGSTISNFSAEQGDQLDFTEIFGDAGMSASDLVSGGYLTVTVNDADHTATIAVDIDSGGSAYTSTQVVTLTNLDAGVTSVDIINQIITQQPTP